MLANQQIQLSWRELSTWRPRVSGFEAGAGTNRKSSLTGNSLTIIRYTITLMLGLVATSSGTLALGQLVRATCTRPLATDAGNKLRRLEQCMAFAIESIDYINTSANQAFLETDPVSRQPRESYVVRYASIALHDVEKALERHQALLQELGPDALKHASVRRSEALLAQDKLRACLRQAEDRLQKMQQLGRTGVDMAPAAATMAAGAGQP